LHFDTGAQTLTAEHGGGDVYETGVLGKVKLNGGTIKNPGKQRKV